MAKLNHENLGSVQKTAYLTATITTVDGELDTACFGENNKCPAGTDIPIFYHCFYEEEKDEPAQRDNGALEGASGAFSKDDEVIVQCEVLDSTTYKPLYVIGFVDKPKSCGFKFKITRDDGVVIDHLLMGYGGIRILQTPDMGTIVGLAYGYDPDYPDYWTHEGDIWTFLYDEDPDYIYTWSYNEVTQIWTVPFSEWEKPVASGKSFRITFQCEDSIKVQYVVPGDPEVPEYAYKAADCGKEENLISVGFYEVKVPLFAIDVDNVFTVFTPPPDLPEAGTCRVGGYSDPYVGRTLTVNSSVDYKVSFKAYGTPYGGYYGSYSSYSSHYCWFVLESAYEHWLCRNIRDDVTVVSSNGDSSVNIDSDPIDSETVVPVTPYTPTENSYTMDMNYMGPDPYNLEIPCAIEEAGDSSVTFPLPFMFFSAYMSMNAYANYD